MTQLDVILYLGLAAAGLTATVRALLDSTSPALLLTKPFSCDLCMSFWCSLALAAVAPGSMPYGTAPGVALTAFGTTVLGAVATALVVTKVANRLST